MKTRLIGVAVLVVAFAVMMNAMALSTATVTSAMALNVVNTSTALIGLSAADLQDSDVAVVTNDGGGAGTLKVTLGAIQPNASYTFNQVFKIKNNSSDALNVTSAVSGAPSGVTVTMVNATDDNPITSTLMASAASINVKLTVVATAVAAAGTPTIDLTVSAVKP